MGLSAKNTACAAFERKIEAVDALDDCTEPSGPAHGPSSLETAKERVMKRTGKLIRVPDREAARPDYKDGLQAMWEDRWILLGDAGRAAWFQRHGQPPPARNPMLDPILILRSVRGLTPGIVKGRVRRTW